MKVRHLVHGGELKGLRTDEKGRCIDIPGLEVHLSQNLLRSAGVRREGEVVIILRATPLVDKDGTLWLLAEEPDNTKDDPLVFFDLSNGDRECTVTYNLTAMQQLTRLRRRDGDLVAACAKPYERARVNVKRYRRSRWPWARTLREDMSLCWEGDRFSSGSCFY